jgi:hypothetical protein
MRAAPFHRPVDANGRGALAVYRSAAPIRAVGSRKTASQKCFGVCANTGAIIFGLREKRCFHFIDYRSFASTIWTSGNIEVDQHAAVRS